MAVSAPDFSNKPDPKTSNSAIHKLILKKWESSTVAETKKLKEQEKPQNENGKGELRPVGEVMEDEFEIGLVGKKVDYGDDNDGGGGGGGRIEGRKRNELSREN